MLQTQAAIHFGEEGNLAVQSAECVTELHSDKECEVGSKSSLFATTVEHEERTHHRSCLMTVISQDHKRKSQELFFLK